MTHDTVHPFGDKAPHAHRPSEHEPRAATQRLAYGAPAASKFVGRVSQLAVEDVRAAVRAWHDVMRTESEAWFGAERAAGNAVAAAGRTAEQEALLADLGESVLRGVWYRDAVGHRPGTPEARVGATEASGQYVAAVAMLALLVRDRLTAAEFALLYRPFAALIPPEELGPE